MSSTNKRYISIQTQSTSNTYDSTLKITKRANFNNNRKLQGLLLQEQTARLSVLTTLVNQSIQASQQLV